ncbi:caspase-3-like isoform X2 [Anneissia japonica]|uniref:caspase-3-like isoform X2 n=1 Tax=Anneissia japonica TaxID=1529436 RepID=UPI0014257777|nr:caspase-3-like isoform X2 [Anneissia japonica]
MTVRKEIDMNANEVDKCLDDNSQRATDTNDSAGLNGFTEVHQVDGITQKFKKMGLPKRTTKQRTDKQRKWMEKMHANPWVYEYNMEKKGRAFIFNNLEFDYAATGMLNRDGADDDAEGLFDAFSELNFKVSTHPNCTLATTRDILYQASQEIDYSEYSSLVIVFMSHGDDGVLYATDGKLPVDELTAPFKGNACPSLAGKPKLFFIQSCRGQKFDEPVGIDVATDEPDSKSLEFKEFKQKIPSEADILLAYACPPNYYSFRSKDDGAWFIEALEFVLKTYATDNFEIQQLLTRVCHIVAYEYESRTGRKATTGKKQVPYIVSTLTKDLYLRSRPSPLK